MCNCILWVRRRLLALLLIIGCMAVSATASATVCFLPDAEDCGLSSASDGNNVCDGSTTYASLTDCNNSITLNNNSQYCEKDGACYRRYCKYPTQSDCEAGVKDYTHKYDHFFCVYDSSTSCYDLQNTPCIEKTTKTGCDGYKLDAPTEGKTCGSCSQRVVTETCSAEGLPGETDEYKTVYDCVEPKYQQIGCDSFDKTETEKNTLEAAPNNYHCTSCTKTNQKQDYEGHWNDYGKGDTMYKCTPTCATYGLVTSCSQGSGEAGTIAFVEDTKGRTNYDGKKCGTCGCTPTPCTGYDYTEDTLSDKSNNVETCNPGCDQPTKYKCKKGYVYDSKSKSCKAKVEECTYTYRKLEASDANGTFIESGSNYQCTASTTCYKGIKANPSVWISRAGTPSVLPIYNKISNTSKSCRRGGTTYYETICEGTPKEECSGGTFTPNDCVSEGYQQYGSEGFIITGTKWGSCSYCKDSEGRYETEDKCKQATNKHCQKTSDNKCYEAYTCDKSKGEYYTTEECQQDTNKTCYKETSPCVQTCEALGYYSTKELCEQGKGSLETCDSHGPCYRRNQIGFSIQLASSQQTSFTCGTQSSNIGSFLLDSNKKNPRRLYNDTLTYLLAGKYYVCADRKGALTTINKVVVEEKTHGTVMCFGDMAPNGCKKTDYTGYGYSCYPYTFESGRTYVVSMYYTACK